MFKCSIAAMIINYLLVWVVFVTGVSCTNVKNIWCLDDNAKSQENLIKNITKDDMLCKPRVVSDFPWKVSDRTSPAPSLLSVNYFTYEVNGTRQIAINVTWRQMASYLNDIESYHLEINFLKPHGHPKQYIMEWDKSLSEAWGNHRSFHDVEFHFIYCGRNGNFHIGPNQKYFFSIQGLPLYNEEDDPQRKSQTLIIPGCKDKEISKTASCVKKSCPKGTRRRGSICKPRTSQSKKKSNIQIPVETTTAREPAGGRTEGTNNAIFIAIGAIILIILLALFIFICFRRRQNDFLQCCIDDKKIPPLASHGRHILIITDIKKDIFSEATMELIRMFQSIDQLHVTTNAQHIVEIGEQGLVKWMTKALEEADFVVFLASDHQNFNIEEETKSLEDGHEQRAFLNATRNIVHSSNDGPEWNHKKFIIADLNDCVTKKNFPFFQYYNLREDFNKFSKHLLGNFHFNVKNKTIFNNLLTNAQLRHGMRSNQSNGVKQQAVSVAIEHNDLDTPRNPSLFNTNREEFNIEMDGPPSCENNASQPYISTDYNNSMDRYHQAGARPKIQC